MPPESSYKMTALQSALRFALVSGIAFMSLQIHGQTPVDPTDKYQWLEDVNGARSMAWVKTENERSAGALENDPRYAGLKADALRVMESPDRLPTPFISGD